MTVLGDYMAVSWTCTYVIVVCILQYTYYNNIQVCPYITHVELYPDVELEISRIESNGGRTDQYRVQFIVSVSDSILRK